MWLWWALGGVAAWIVVAFAAAVVVGRGIRLAERHEIEASSSLTTADVLGRASADVPAEPRRRRIPLPPFGIGLAATAVVLETVGFVLRQIGNDTRLLSMDGVYSLPRMYVAALFAGAALIAAAGAGAIRGRRSWWIAVAVVAGMIAAVKAGSTVHAEFITALVQTVGRPVALITSAALAGAGIALLWVLSRHDRRDRRRVLGSLTAYAVAAVGLSAISNSVGASWSTVSTYLEEAGEGLSGVAFLVAVVVGVAPRVALPAAWPLRREVDAQTLDLPERAPGGLRDSAG